MRVLLMKDGFQSIEYLQDNVKLAWNKTQDRYTRLLPKGNKKETLLSIYIYIYFQPSFTIKTCA
jgi:hypothetical protein